jgi:hypothetical protein
LLVEKLFIRLANSGLACNQALKDPIEYEKILKYFRKGGEIKISEEPGESS